MSKQTEKLKAYDQIRNIEQHCNDGFAPSQNRFKLHIANSWQRDIDDYTHLVSVITQLIENPQLELFDPSEYRLVRKSRTK